MDTPVCLLLVALSATLVQVQCSGTCSSQFPVISGPPGRDGIRGHSGPKGDKGDRGDAGRDGRDGIQGVPGRTGDKGDPGTFSEEEFICVSDNVTAKVVAELMESIQTLNNTVEMLREHVALRPESKNSSESNNTCNHGVFRIIASFNTSNGDSCPDGLRTVTNPDNGQIACGRNVSYGCTSLTFTVDAPYTCVRGRLRGYQQGAPDAFGGALWASATIDSQYLDGISITHGAYPRTHLWSYACGVSENYEIILYRCPCAVTNQRLRPALPDYIGEHYYCESGYVSGYLYGTNVAWDNPLWDGEGCVSAGNECCNRSGEFTRTIQETSDDIEVRFCGHYSLSNEDVLVDQLEISVM